MRRRPHAGHGIGGIRDHERPVLSAQKPGRVKSLHAVAFAADFEVLPNINERRHIWISRPESAREHGTHVRCGYRLRWRIPGMPMELMPGMQNVAQVTHTMRADQGAPVHYLRDPLEP